MATLYHNQAVDARHVYLKGSLESILARCDKAFDSQMQPTVLSENKLHQQVESLAAQGLQVLELARGEHDYDVVQHEQVSGGLIFPGLQAMIDPRPEAITSIAACFAPEQKLQLVKALQANGHIIAMTGDGVNNAPALRQANIGLAMGRGGAEAAKETAAIVLTDDLFSSIASAVEEECGVFDNLIKFIVWTLPTNGGEGLVISAAIFANVALPITPVQVLWINMSTAVLLGLMLAFEPKEPDLMSRKPRDPQTPTVTLALEPADFSRYPDLRRVRHLCPGRYAPGRV